MKVCIIPARGGSKRILNKNIKEFHGKPIIAYSIEAAISSGCFDKVIVSTDDEEIAKVARFYGAQTPFVRPEELSNDFTPTLPVIKHAIEWLEKNGETLSYACCFYATAPFVDALTLQKAFSQLQESGADYCFTVTNFPSPIQRAIQITDTNRLQMFNPENLNVRSQDLVEAYHDAGQFYWGKTEAFKQEKALYSAYASPYILPRYLVQDLDTPDDWIRAELMYQVLEYSRSIDAGCHSN